MVADTIKLPNDPTLVARLQRKLTEYHARMSPFCGPEVRTDSMCKLTILTAVLESGSVEFTALYDRIQGSGATIEPAIFCNAWGVINDYCTTGGANVKGGHLS